MKTKTLIAVLSICILSLNAIAQQPHGARSEERKENIESMKIAFITQKLDLTPEEAQKFWPVYNQYTDKAQELRKKRKHDNHEAKQDVELLSDREVEQIVDYEIISRQKELDLQKEYHAKFKTVLPIKKVAKLYAAEDQFKVVLLHKLKDKDRERKPGRQ